MVRNKFYCLQRYQPLAIFRQTGQLTFFFISGQFNSWDRQPYAYHDDADAPNRPPISAATGWHITPAMHQLRRNLIININFLGSCDFCFYAVDLDDGSSQYNITYNVLVYGGVKVNSTLSTFSLNELFQGGTLAP